LFQWVSSRVWFERPTDLQQTMSKTRIIFFPLLLAFSAVVQAETFSGRLMDVLCRPENVAVGTKKCPHVKSCMISPRCSESGYGLILSDGTFLKFDAPGNAKALAALKALTSEDEVNAKVTGTRTEKALKVDSLEITK
jgi:hypothetical protein